MQPQILRLHLISAQPRPEAGAARGWRHRPIVIPKRGMAEMPSAMSTEDCVDSIRQSIA
jgi:hypothetical protein